MAGYLEGRASAVDIFNFLDNMRYNNPDKHNFNQMKKFFTDVVFNIQNKINQFLNLYIQF